MQFKSTYLALALLAGFGLALGACSSGGDDAPPAVTPDPDPPAPHACDAGASQACVDARQAELDALGDDATVAQVNAARAALTAAQTALAEANAAAHRAALVQAAMCTAGTQACVDAHQALVDALKADSTTTVAALDAAEAALASVQMAKAEADAAAARQMARQALIDAAMCTAGTQACVDAHQALVDALTADDTTSAQDLADAQAALSAVQMAKATADAAAHRQSLVDAAMCTDATQACVDAHNALVTALDADPSTSADDLEDARNALAAVQTAFNNAEAARMAAEARQALMTAAMCTDATQACVDAHNAWLSQLQAELADVMADDDATNAEVNLAQVAVNNAMMARDTVQTAFNEAEAERMAMATATSAISDAETAVSGLDADASQAEVDAANALVMAARTAVNALDDAGDLEGQVAALESTIMGHNTRIADAVEAAQVVAATAAAATKKTAITTEAGQATDAGLGGSGVTATGNDEGAYNLEIARDRTETTITVRMEGATDDDDVVFDHLMGPMYNRMMDPNADGDVVEEIAAVWTDIQAPRAVEFAKFENADETTPQALDVLSTTGVTTTDAEANPNDALGIVAGNLTMLKTDGITATGAGTVTLLAAVADDDTTPNVDETVVAFSTAATFNGSAGTLRCGGSTDCTATLDADGMITAVTGGWAFIPADGAMTDQPDYDYLHYGFWLQKTTDEDGAVTYDEVETFAGSSIDQSTGLGAVTGRATYDGDAAGVYVREVYKSTTDPSIDTATSGHFTADVNLVAHFGQTVDDPDTTNVNEAGRLAPNLLNTLTGTINNFVLSGGEDNSWSVSLQETPDPTTGNIEADGTASGAAQGGGDAGTWNAVFHGPTADDTQPHTVVGEFNANFGNGTAAGAFGARKE